MKTMILNKQMGKQKRYKMKKFVELKIKVNKILLIAPKKYPEMKFKSQTAMN